MTIACSVCGTEVQTLDRYPRRVCGTCEARAVSPDGIPVTFTQGPRGMEAWTRETKELHEGVTEHQVVLIDGVEHFVEEGRFGGIVVQPWDEQHSLWSWWHERHHRGNGP